MPRVTGTEWADWAIDSTIRLISICPKCAEQGVQEVHSRTVPGNFSGRDHAIEAYCTGCDQFWAVDLRERTALARLLAVLQALAAGAPPLDS